MNRRELIQYVNNGDRVLITDVKEVWPELCALLETVFPKLGVGYNGKKVSKKLGLVWEGASPHLSVNSLGDKWDVCRTCGQSEYDHTLTATEAINLLKEPTMETFIHTDGKKYRIVNRGEANGVVPVHSDVLVSDGVNDHWSERRFLAEKRLQSAEYGFVTETTNGRCDWWKQLAVPVTNEEILRPYAIKCKDELEWNAVVDALGDDAEWQYDSEYYNGTHIKSDKKNRWYRPSSPGAKEVITATEALALCGIPWPDERMEAIARMEAKLDEHDKLGEEMREELENMKKEVG
jgi:hypothetical protein